MKASEFVAEFNEECFPRMMSRLFSMESHDPPWTKTQLRAMAKQGVIMLEESNWTYRLTLKATDIKDKQQECDK